LRDDIAGEARTFTGERDPLVSYLRDLPRDGGTRLAALDLDVLPHPDDEAWFVFSDGLNTLGRGLPRAGTRPVHTISSAAASDAAYLRQVSSRSGGTYVDLLRMPPSAAARLVPNQALAEPDSLAERPERRVLIPQWRTQAGRYAALARIVVGSYKMSVVSMFCDQAASATG